MDKRNGSRIVVVAMVTAAMTGGLPGELGSASSHFEAPISAANLAMDAADLYAFTSPEAQDTVTLIADFASLQPPMHIPGDLAATKIPFTTDEFEPRARYEIHVDNTGDARPDITYRWVFRRDGGLAVPRRRYTLTEVRPGQPARTLIKDGPVAPPDAGPITPGYEGLRKRAIVALPNGGRAFAGKAADPFFADGKLFTMALAGQPLPFTFSLPYLFNLNAVAVQLPKRDLALGGDLTRNPVVGLWMTSSRESFDMQTGKTSYRQISRLGNPLFNFLMPVPAKDGFNTSTPSEDHTNPTLMNAAAKTFLVPFIAKTVGIPAPTPPYGHITQSFLTGIASFTGPLKTDLNALQLNKDVDPAQVVSADMLRLNMATPVTPVPNRMGYLFGDLQGWPNGRRLVDDATAAIISGPAGLMQGRPVPGWITNPPIKGPSAKLGTTFPYLALPHAPWRPPGR